MLLLEQYKLPKPPEQIHPLPSVMAPELGHHRQRWLEHPGCSLVECPRDLTSPLEADWFLVCIPKTPEPQICGPHFPGEPGLHPPCRPGLSGLQGGSLSGHPIREGIIKAVKPESSFLLGWAQRHQGPGFSISSLQILKPDKALTMHEPSLPPAPGGHADGPSTP